MPTPSQEVRAFLRGSYIIPYFAFPMIFWKLTSRRGPNWLSKVDDIVSPQATSELEAYVEKKLSLTILKHFMSLILNLVIVRFISKHHQKISPKTSAPTSSHPSTSPHLGFEASRPFSPTLQPSPSRSHCVISCHSDFCQHLPSQRIHRNSLAWTQMAFGNKASLKITNPNQCIAQFSKKIPQHYDK